MQQLPTPPTSVNLTGKYIGVYLSNAQPVTFILEGVEFLPVFSTPEKYEAGMAAVALPSPAKIQVITDHAEFIESVYGKVRLMLDPWRTERGTTRFTELTIPFIETTVPTENFPP
jgi:hypothetical protein